jgi:hypothetical protein
MRRASSACRYQLRASIPESPENQEFENAFNCIASPIGSFGHFVSKNKTRKCRKSAIFDCTKNQMDSAQMVRSLGLIKTKIKI